MTAAEEFRRHDERQFDPFRMMVDFEEQERERRKEFSAKIGGRALRLMKAFGVASRERWVEYEDGYSLATTLTHSNVKEFSSQRGARLHIKRESMGFWAPGGFRLAVGRLAFTGIGPITELQLDYINEHESISSVSLSHYQYGEAFPVTSQGQQQICTTYEKLKDQFLEQFEAIEHEAFPR